MTKAEFIELIQETISGGIVTDDVRKRYHPEVIAASVDAHLESMASMIVNSPKENDEYGLSALAAIIPCVNQQCEGKGGRWYVEIEKPFMNLPNNKGIVSITGVTGHSGKVELVSAYEASDIEDTDASSTMTVGYLIGNKIFIVNGPEGKEVGFRLTIIPKFRELDWDDEVYVPNGKTSELISMVISLMNVQKQTPPEKFNDNKPDS